MLRGCAAWRRIRRMVSRPDGFWRSRRSMTVRRVPDKGADSVVEACARVLLPLADRLETITYDNGNEFAWRSQPRWGPLSHFCQPLSLVGTRPRARSCFNFDYGKPGSR